MVTGTAAQTQDLTLRDRVTAEEWQIRTDLAACYRLAAHFGWDELIFTHFSARVPGAPGAEEHFLINPFGLMFEEITASSLLKVDLKGELVMASDYFINPAGFVIHGAIHGARRDARCVLHTHTVAGVAVAAQKAGLLPISQNALLFHGDIAYHDYEGLALEMEERERLIANMGSANLLILRNHGLLCVGETIAEAFVRLFFLERACETQIAAQGGGELLIQESDVVDKVGNQARFGAGQSVAGMVWDALLRKIDRIDPDYKI